MSDQVPNNVNPEEITDEQPKKSKGKSGAVCEKCEGTGLLDLKTHGNAANQLCPDCEGSGTV